jgi:chromosomal replication initiation ATPase DnaA
MGKSRHFFPGGNTSQGFYSFYHYLVKPTVKRKFILKGGPGVGKSHLMKQIGTHFLDKGQSIEYQERWMKSSI